MWNGYERDTTGTRSYPNHSPRVEGDHYLSATTPAQRRAVEEIIEDAQNDMLRRAQPPIRVRPGYGGNLPSTVLMRGAGDGLSWS